MAKRPTGVNPALAEAVSTAQCNAMTSHDKAREERLAKALRENLRKRKAQAREIEKPVTPSDGGSPDLPH